MEPVNPLKTLESPPALFGSEDWLASSGEGDIGSSLSEAGWPRETIRRSMLVVWSQKRHHVGSKQRQELLAIRKQLGLRWSCAEIDDRPSQG